MQEKDSPSVLTAEPEEKKEENDPVQEEWKKLFKTISLLAEKRNRPVNEIYESGEIKKEEAPSVSFELRINPAIEENGILQVVVLDLLYSGKPIQQWVGKENKTEEKTSIKIDSVTFVEENELLFGRGDIAIYADALLKRKINALESKVGVLNLLMSRNYSNNSN